MDYCTLGQTELRVSRLCLGTMSYGSPEWRPWVLEAADGEEFIKLAWKHGINFFDTANMYSRGLSEEMLGRAIRKLPCRREEVVIGTKVFYSMTDDPSDGGLSRTKIMKEVDDSLRRLQTDYIDLYQIHRWDDDTPIDETLEAMNELVRAGKVRYLGASSMFAWQLAKALHIADRSGWARFVSMQNHYNLIYREEEREMVPLCIDENVSIIPWSPMARGFLAGTADRSGARRTLRARTDTIAQEMYYQECDFVIAERVASVAKQRACSPSQVALAWLLGRPGVTAAVIGATKTRHLDDAVGALGVELSAEECSFLGELYSPHPILGY